MEDENNIQTAIDAGIHLAKIQTPSPLKCGEPMPFIMRKHDFAIEDLERLMPTPARIRAHPCLNTLESFMRYVNAFKNEATPIFVITSEAGADFLAPIDYYGKDAPKWCNHHARYQPPHSIEWKTWMTSNDKWIMQRDFAEFFEQNLPDVTKPDGATMMETILSLSASTKVDFKSAVRLDNGNVQLMYEENTEASAGTKGKLKIPEQFELFIPVFHGGDSKFVEARLRYRISDEAKLTLKYVINRPHIIIRDTVEKMIKEIVEETGITPFEGSAGLK